MIYHSPWPAEFRRIAFIIAPLVGVGLVFNVLWPALLAGVSAYLGWHIWQQYRLVRWLRYSRSMHPPESTGLWGEIYDQVYSMQRRNHRRKKRLRAILREFRQSTAAMPDGTVVLTPDHRIIWFNAAAQRMLQLNTAEDMGQHILNLLRSPRFADYFHSDSFHEPVEMDSPFQNGVRLSLQLIPYGRDQRLLIIRDITRMHRLEQVRRDFVANASHELRTPLTVITGYLEHMREDDGAAAEEWRRPVEEMYSQSARMRSILEDLLLLSRLDAQPDPESEEPVRVAEVIRGICRDGRVVAGNTVELDCSIAEGVLIHGTHAELRSAFSNLVQNAVKYTPAGGDVTLRWYIDDDGSGCFEVTDTGIGIAPEHIPRLTERFYRVDEGRSRDKGGTGLGLSIVRHALQRHDASLEIDSELGRGSTFRARFPAARLYPEGPRPVAAGGGGAD